METKKRLLSLPLLALLLLTPYSTIGSAEKRNVADFTDKDLERLSKQWEVSISDSQHDFS